MGLVVQALTSDDEEEITHLLSLLLQSSAGTGFLHESFLANDFKTYTRPWFAWMNGLFGELVLKVIEERPWLILKDVPAP